MKLKTNYWTETHHAFKKLGNSLLAAATAGATFAIVNDDKTLVIIGTVGKFISNLFSTNDPV